MNPAVVTNLARAVWGDLRQKRLWPVALALLVAIVAVPVLLSRSPSTPGVASLPGGTSGGAGPAIPAVNASASPTQSDLRGPGRDPFGQPATAQANGGAGSVLGSSSGGTTGTTAGGGGPVGGTSTGTAGTVVSSPAPAGGAPPPPLPASKPPPPPPGLSSTQSYDVEISITNASGGLNRIDPVERLSPLPSSQQPLLVELGVLQGGHRVLFAVAPGTVLRGPGTCVPGSIDCEILSLGQNQIESLATDVSSSPVAMFAVTGITAVGHSSVGAAQEARRSESAVGRQLLDELSLPALSLFSYNPGVGAVIDLRNLTLGES